MATGGLSRPPGTLEVLMGRPKPKPPKPDHPNPPEPVATPVALIDKNGSAIGNATTTLTEKGQ